jgi:hypothetical protein
MNKLFDTFWLVSALVIASALVMLALPILALMSLLVLLTPAAFAAFSRSRRSGRPRVFGPPPQMPSSTRPVIIETSFRRLDPHSGR